MPARQRAPQQILTGVPEVDAALKELKSAVANRVARSALSKGARLSTKKIKAGIPSSLKSVRRSIGTSAKKNKLTKVWEAKAGAGVGKRKESRGGTKGGVGISSRNVHWWFLGTGERRHKSGKSTGKMPAVGKGIVAKAVSSGGGEILSVIKQGVREGIEREAVKARAKGKTIR